MRTTTTSYSIGPRTSYFFHVFNLSYKSRGPGQAKPEPSRGWWLWPGLGFQKAKAVPGQAKAPAFRPSRAGTTLILTVLRKQFTAMPSQSQNSNNKTREMRPPTVNDMHSFSPRLVGSLGEIIS